MTTPTDRPTIPGPGTGPLLTVRDVSLSFGGVQALTAVGFDVHDGEILGLIGPNGAGKTSLFNVISRLYRPDSGAVRFQGTDLLSVRPHRVTTLGLARTFQHAMAIPELTVLESVMIGAYRFGRANWLTAPLGWRRRSDRVQAETLARDALARVALEDRASQVATSLPLGLLKRLDIARALVGDPDVILLDEPANGLTHDEVDRLGAMLRGVRDDHGTSLVLVEHHMGLVMSISDRLVVLDLGKVIADGPPDEVAEEPAVVAAYMGESVR